MCHRTPGSSGVSVHRGGGGGGRLTSFICVGGGSIQTGTEIIYSGFLRRTGDFWKFFFNSTGFKGITSESARCSPLAGKFGSWEHPCQGMKDLQEKHADRRSWTMHQEGWVSPCANHVSLTKACKYVNVSLRKQVVTEVYPSPHPGM